MPDKYYVYRPLLDLIGFTEGTDKGRGYNETLAYGAYTGGNVDLVSMTLAQIDKLQTKMLANPKNTMNSSALGRYQIVRTTLREIVKTLGLQKALLFDKDLQDRCACYLLGVRGIDKYLAGRLSEDTLINNLAHEWASFPLTTGKGAYGGQNAAVKPPRVRAALAAVKARHKEGQPVEKVEVPVIVPVTNTVVPEAVDKAVTKQTNGWGWAGVGLGGIGSSISAFAGLPWQTTAVFAGLIVAGGILALIIGPWIVGRVKTIRAAVQN